MLLPDEFIQELKFRNNITDVVSGYVNLRRRGRNSVGLCPFHGEKTPSFNVYDDSNSFYCFGCGAGGDVITFIRMIENLDYIDSVKFLAQRSGLQMPENHVDDSMSKLRTRIYEANREAARFFHKMLYSREGAPALEYLRKRDLTEKTIKHFGLGYSPSSRFALANHLKSKGFSDNEIIQANLAFESRSGKAIDRFVDRVMFPIIDLRGNVIAFGGRIMGDGKPKYLNTSDTLVFKKSQNLFAFNFAKNSAEKNLILAEGYMDVIALHQAGFENTVATLGTAITPEQARLMSRYVNEVAICYDSDEAGQKATSRAIPILRDANLLVKVLSIPKGKDPDEFMRTFGEQGPIRFRQLLQDSGNDVEYRMQKVRLGCDISSPDGKLNYINKCTKIIASLDNRIEREIYASRLSEEVGIEKASILLQIDTIIKRNKRETSKRQFKEIQNQLSGFQDKINPEKKDNLRAANAEEALIAYIINNPDMANNIISRLPSENFITAFNRRVYSVIFERAKNNRPIGLTEISSEFSINEIGRITKMVTSYSPETFSAEAAEEYIKVICSENNKMTSEKIVTADADDIKKYMEKLKELKK